MNNKHIYFNELKSDYQNLYDNLHRKKLHFKETYVNTINRFKVDGEYKKGLILSIGYYSKKALIYSDKKIYEVDNKDINLINNLEFIKYLDKKSFLLQDKSDSAKMFAELLEYISDIHNVNIDWFLNVFKTENFNNDDTLMKVLKSKHYLEDEEIDLSFYGNYKKDIKDIKDIKDTLRMYDRNHYLYNILFNKDEKPTDGFINNAIKLFIFDLI